MGGFTRRAVDRVRTRAVSLVGLGLLGIVGAYGLAFGGPYPLLVLETIVPTTIGLGLVWYGLRNDDDESGTERATIVTISSCCSGALGAIFCLCSIYLLSLRMGFSGGLAQPAINALSVGLGFGAVLGHVYVELSNHYRENERLSRAVDASMDGIAVIVDSRRVYVNEAYASLYGLQNEAVLEGHSGGRCIRTSRGAESNGRSSRHCPIGATSAAR